ncbi:MAG TPA: hypothetical protein VIS49_12915, partial [Cyclobacteriaceae bacterium]
MKLLLIFLMSFACLANAKAQEFAFEYWHEGKMVLENGDTLRGLIKYDMQTDLIQFKANDRLETYTARKMLYLEIYDQTVRRYRRMFSLPYNTSGEYRAPVIFELLVEGTITLLCREALEYKT